MVYDPDDGVTPLYGLTDPDTLTVYITKGPLRKMREILYHELTHVAVYSTGFWRVLEATIPRERRRELVEELMTDLVMPCYLDCCGKLGHTRM